MAICAPSCPASRPTCSRSDSRNCRMPGSSSGPTGGAGWDATCRVEIDGRRFEFAVKDGRLAAAHGEPAVTVTARAADLVTVRLGSTEAKRKAALRRITFAGDQQAIDRLRTAFALSQG